MASDITHRVPEEVLSWKREQGSFGGGSEGAARPFSPEPVPGHTPRGLVPPVRPAPRAPARVPVPIPAGSRRRRRAAGWLGRRAQQAPEMRVVLLLTPQQRQQGRAVAAQRLPQQVAVHGEPARLRRPSPRSRKPREAKLPRRANLPEALATASCLSLARLGGTTGTRRKREAGLALRAE